MKKLGLLLFAVIGIVSLSFGQAKKGIQTVVIKTPTVQCDMCKERIENMFARETGVQRSFVDIKKKTTKVVFVAERTNIENVKTAIANAGYDADDVTANEESYKKLPTCCKKPAEGSEKKH